MRWWVFNPRLRLAVPAEMPRLDVNEAIDRGWHLSQRRDRFPRVWLLLPNPEKFLTTQPRLPAHRVVVPRTPRED